MTQATTRPAPTPPVTTPTPVPPAVRERLARRWTRARWVVAVALVVVLSALAVAIATPRGTSERLDPEGTGQDGSRAVAQILRRQGVEVTKVTRSADAERLARAGTTLVVVNPAVIGPRQLDRLDRASPSVLALVAPDAVVLDRLVPGVTPAGVLPPQDRAPGCDDADAAAAGETAAGDHVYRAGSGAAAVCYPATGTSGAGSYLRLRAGGRDVRIIGQPRVLANRYLADQGNAALALRALGTQPRLVWYYPDPLEVSAQGEPPSLFDLMPPWVGWVTAQLALAVLVALAWRSRRLGRLVAEPLPVVVRAAETEEGRARLYRQAGARGRAAATLRTATLRRIAERLSVPAGTTPEQVATLLCAATGRPDREVRDVLLGPAPANDAALVALADDLDALERSLDQGVATTPHADGPAGRTQEP